MPRPKADAPLEKVTINLYQGDSRHLQQIYSVGASRVIREMVRGHIRKVEAKADPKAIEEDIDLGEILAT